MEQEKPDWNEASRQKRRRWKRLLALALVVCVLLAPFAKRAVRKLSSLCEAYARQRAEKELEDARANRIKHPPIEITEEMRNGTMYQALQKAQNVCFVGDSITKGPSSNGFVPWFEPMEQLVQGTVTNCGWGGATVQILLDDHMDAIKGVNADLYVVAIGTNDVMHRNPATCAMDPQSYLERMSLLREEILAEKETAAFVWIAPWYSVETEHSDKQSYAEELALFRQYDAALKRWATELGDGFIDPNPLIQETFARDTQREYMVDEVHPSAEAGVELYCRAVLLYQN